MSMPRLFFAGLTLLSAPGICPAADKPLPVFGRSIQLDPSFPYYRERSADSIAAEVRANGYGIVRYIVTAESRIQPALVAALHRERIAVWYTTFANGTYSRADLPPGWEPWKMVTRTELAGGSLNDGYTRLCLNNPDYRAWKKAQMAKAMQTAPFDGIDIAEPHWPEYPGIESPAYGCFCPQCLAAFRRMCRGEDALPDILNAESPRSPQRNPALWRKWLGFRRASLTDFLNDLVNGRDGIRQAAPKAKVCTWTLALREGDGLRRVLEDSGEDAGEIARVVRPDLHCLQTHWPDWLRADLPPSYAEGYKPFIAQIREAAPRLPLMIQADIGSKQQNRRSWKWIKEFENACAKLGVEGTTLYEYHIGEYMFTDPPRIAEARRIPGGIELRFTKRLDERVAADRARFAVTRGRITNVQLDGSVVRLSLSGLQPDEETSITVRGIADAPARRFANDRPAAVLESQTVACNR